MSQIASTAPPTPAAVTHDRRQATLRGRSAECAALERLLARLRAGGSPVLVLRAEAGAGKTALLEHLLSRAAGCRIVRAAGAEPEKELPYAGLQQLCAPMLDRRDALPAPQRDALSTAFGLSGGDPPDRFFVALAVLSLCAETARERPLLCVIDDAQWLDRVSAQAVGFVGRRLAQSVALVLALRETGDEGEFPGLPDLAVPGLTDADAHALLESAIPGRLDERVRDRIVAEARGNPRALLAWPRAVTPAKLAGGFGLPAAGTPPCRTEREYLRRLEPLPGQTRRLLLTAAAEPVGDAALIWRAAQRLGLGADAAGPAEAARLIELGARVRFCHPLARSAAYRAAAVRDRREVHRALAEATDPQADPDRRAWHRGQAAVVPDETVAAELEGAAGRARLRGGAAAAAAFLERATDLTPEPARRGPRALAAAQAKFDAAAYADASELAASAHLCPLDALQSARPQRLQGRLAFARRRGADAAPLLLDAARRVAPFDARLARETYLEALVAAIFAGRLGAACGVAEAAEAARAAPPAPDAPRAIDLLLDGLVTRCSDGYAAGMRPLRLALHAYVEEQRRGAADLRWLWLAWPVASELWDDRAWPQMTARAVTLAREAGALAGLPIALLDGARVHVFAGELAAASAHVDEAQAIVAATGGAPLAYGAMALAAYRGREAEALERIGSGVEDAAARGEGRALAVADYARAVLYNGLGRYRDARAAAERACEHDDLGLLGWSLFELVEAGFRCGGPDVAAAALRRLEERAGAAGTDWALGMQAVARALLSDGDAADALHRDAIERLGRTRITVHLARAHLLYGEWLRRRQRRVDARGHLRTAYETFAAMGAQAFAERSRGELEATGESVRRLADDTRDALTPQEAQIARLAGDGHTNPEIGAQLFISPRTVEYHLRKVFTKRGVSSRKELRAALAGGAVD
jgi:DNA-binding CsgD family transcriptional regulator